MDISHVEEGNGSNRNGGVSPRWSGARGVHEHVDSNEQNDLGRPHHCGGRSQR